MNLAAAAPLWLLILLAALLAAAAIEDAIRLRISNATVLGVIIAAGIAMALAGFPIGLWQNALVFVGLLVAGTFLFSAGWMGGGDVKLLAALGLWVNLSDALWLLVSVFLAGGLIAMLYIIARPLRRRAGGPGEKLIGSQIPYGLAIASGAAIMFAAHMNDSGSKLQKQNRLPFSVERK